jgi:phospholipid transport system transporter-binding protein
MIINDQEMSLKNATAISRIGIEAIQNASGDVEIDLSAITSQDSSAVAVMLEWQRCAQSSGRRLSFKGVPDGLVSLVAVYGMSQFFTITSTNSSLRH